VQLEGHLAVFPLRELIEMILYSSVQGMLEVHSNELTAQIYFRDGQPTHACAGELRGIAAVARLFELPDGDFRFYSGSEPDNQTIWLDPHDLIERSEQMARQWAPLRPHIPALTWIPVLISGANMPSINIGEKIWPVLAAVDGQRAIMVIADELRLDYYDVCSALVVLKNKGMITIMAPTVPLPQANVSATPTASKRGFFERLIDRTLEEEAQNPGSRYAPPEKRYVESE
jgi:hypothetical protein